MDSSEFETRLADMRLALYRYPEIDIINVGFRPVGGMPADFCVIEHRGRHHFFYIERRLQESTGFFPGHEIYFGHASTANFFDWEVHDPVMLIRPGTWEGAHVWAPFVLAYQGTYVMAYTGVNCYLSQDIGLASSDDLFEWKRFDSNPTSPARNRPWSFWREDGIASCRDPHMLEYDGRVWMTYTTNTKACATCIAICSTEDLARWEDHGPILVGPADGYEMVTSRSNPFARGRPQGQLESSYLLRRNDKWYLLVQTHLKGTPVRNWVFESDDMGSFDFSTGREFWAGAYTVEVVKERGTKALLACTGPIRFGSVDWADETPRARFLSNREELEAWQEES
jgi:predicted GH43/DUF377 family glycosyl hydrolase